MEEPLSRLGLMPLRLIKSLDRAACIRIPPAILGDSAQPSTEAMDFEEFLLAFAVPSDDAERWREALERSAARMEPYTIDFRLLPRPGSMRWWRHTAAPARSDDGTVSWTGVALDIT
ncbi:MAG TPA: PAS domain-containing protein, partial [Alphaproteobacteria bacterium]